MSTSFLQQNPLHNSHNRHPPSQQHSPQEQLQAQHGFIASSTATSTTAAPVVVPPTPSPIVQSPSGDRCNSTTTTNNTSSSLHGRQATRTPVFWNCGGGGGGGGGGGLGSNCNGGANHAGDTPSHIATSWGRRLRLDGSAVGSGYGNNSNNEHGNSAKTRVQTLMQGLMTPILACVAPTNNHNGPSGSHQPSFIPSCSSMPLPPENGNANNDGRCTSPMAVPMDASQYAAAVQMYSQQHQQQRSRGRSSSSSNSPIKGNSRHHPAMVVLSQQQQSPGGVITTITERDILCGRGSSSTGSPPCSHPGNVHFRQLVAAHKADYPSLTKKQKMMLGRALVDVIHASGGRFLARCSNNNNNNNNNSHNNNSSNGWEDIGLPRSLEKTSQALREKPIDAEPAAAQPKAEAAAGESPSSTPRIKNSRSAILEPPLVRIPPELRHIYRPAVAAPSTPPAMSGAFSSPHRRQQLPGQVPFRPTSSFSSSQATSPISNNHYRHNNNQHHHHNRHPHHRQYYHMAPPPPPGGWPSMSFSMDEDEEYNFQEEAENNQNNNVDCDASTPHRRRHQPSTTAHPVSPFRKQQHTSPDQQRFVSSPTTTAASGRASGTADTATTVSMSSSAMSGSPFRRPTSGYSWTPSPTHRETVALFHSKSSGGYSSTSSVGSEMSYTGFDGANCGTGVATVSPEWKRQRVQQQQELKLPVRKTHHYNHSSEKKDETNNPEAMMMIQSQLSLEERVIGRRPDLPSSPPLVSPTQIMQQKSRLYETADHHRHEEPAAAAAAAAEPTTPPSLQRSASFPVATTMLYNNNSADSSMDGLAALSTAAFLRLDEP